MSRSYNQPMAMAAPPFQRSRQRYSVRTQSQFSQLFQQVSALQCSEISLMKIWRVRRRKSSFSPSIKKKTWPILSQICVSWFRIVWKLRISNLFASVPSEYRAGMWAKITCLTREIADNPHDSDRGLEFTQTLVSGRILRRKFGC